MGTMEDGRKKSVQVRLGPPVVVAMGPPGVVGPRTWGFYQFPDMWRGADGEIYLAMNVGADSEAGRHEPTQFFVSRNDGHAWKPVDVAAIDNSPVIVTLHDGSQVAFGQERRIYHYTSLSPAAKREKLSTNALDMKPVMGPFRNGYRVNEYLVYRYADIPEQLRRFPMALRISPNAPWQQSFGTIEMPDMLLRTLVRAMWWDDKGKEEWIEKSPQLSIPVPNRVVVLPDGTILWAHASQHPAVDKRYDRVLCLASGDAGRTWHARGTIADDLTTTTWGYGAGEQSLARMPGGDLLCVMRTKMSNEAEDTHFLAVARSTDNGFHWAKSEPLSQFSVTPHLIVLDNGLVALVYGRPGVHVRVSGDSGLTWTQSVPVVGPSETGLMSKPLSGWWAIRHDFSCSNTHVVVTGPDRFLLAYSDFQHEDEQRRTRLRRGFGGQARKAIKVREVAVARDGVI